MKVATATSAMIESFRDVYPDIFSLDKNINENNLDLLIFTGGQDLNPAQYGQHPNGSMGWSDHRDKQEFSTLKRWLSGKLKSKRILGVCRGLQLLNVGFGGTLNQDMDHPGVHRIEWTRKNPFDSLKVVNSLHHQAIAQLGNAYRFNPVILGVEPETQIIEAVMWKDSILAVQFHPEFFGREAKANFFSIVNKWVNGELSIFARDKEEVVSKVGVFYSTLKNDSTSAWYIENIDNPHLDPRGDE